MTRTAPVAVLIPTYKRGLQILSVLEKIQACDPCPIETWVHVDLGEGPLESELNRLFPNVRTLKSTTRVGPGGGRHRCLLACSAPYAVSFDDDSYPIDTDFFSRVEQLFLAYPTVAVFGASIWHRNEPEKSRMQTLTRSPSYTGCGFAIRLSAYRTVRGLLSRPVCYGMEELDLSMQLFAKGWEIYEAGDLRVLHDTELRHHESLENNAGAITNVALFGFLHFPISCLGLGLLQLGNRVAYSIKMRRLRGICSGLLKIPFDCYRYRHYRRAVAWPTLNRFLELRRGPSRNVAPPKPGDQSVFQ